MITRRQAFLTCAAGLAGAAETKTDSGQNIHVVRVPGNGLQPQAIVDEPGTLHLVYYTGEAMHGDLSYVRSTDFGGTFSSPVSVNSQPGSAIARGSIRGAQLAVGKGGRVHVAWNGSGQARPQGPINPETGKPGEPMLYTRLDNSGKVFEPQRNLMRHSFALDGGGSVAADGDGNVYVGWHANAPSRSSGRPVEGEAGRQVFIAKSQDEGRTFSAGAKAWSRETGACGCCGMKIFAGRQGRVVALYRSATESVHRDVYLLVSNDRGQSFRGNLLHKWDINACPMSSMHFAENGKVLVAAWETGGQVYWTRLDGNEARAGKPVPAPGEGNGRKHPRLAVNQKGEVLLVWTEGMGHRTGGSLAYQVYESDGRLVGENKQLPGIPAYSFAAAIARPDQGFTVLY